MKLSWIRETHWSAISAWAVLGVMCAAALLAPLLAPYSPSSTYGSPFEEPTWSHPLGLDDAGHDVLSTLVYGARASILVGVSAGFVAVAVGVTVGVCAGYYVRADPALGRTTDFFLVIPILPLVIVLGALFGSSTIGIILVIGALSWPPTARLMRSQVKSLRERVFVRRVETLGATGPYVIRRHVLPHVGPLLVSSGVLAVANAVFFEAALSFLGIGGSMTSWGSMIATAFERSAASVGAWWAIVPPGLAIAMLILCCSLIGRSTEERLNPRLSVSHLATSKTTRRDATARGRKVEAT